MAGHLAGEAEHGAVAADDDGQVAARAQLLGRQGLKRRHAGVERGLAFEGNIEALPHQKIGNLLQNRANAAGLVFADDCHMLETFGHSEELHHSTMSVR